MLPKFNSYNKYLENDVSKDNSLFTWDSSSSTIKVRFILISCFFIMCFSVISYRLIITAISQYRKQNVELVKNNFRKEIVDRNGALLAANLPSSSLFANPQKVVNPEESLRKLSSIIPNINIKKLLDEFKKDKTFVWIKRDLSTKEQTDIFNLGLTGFEFEHEQKRIYTFSNLLSHVIGYVGRDFKGLAGLEKYYDEFLANKDSKPLQLSIDARLQNILNEEIEKSLKEFNAIGAVGIIADPNNGEILAMLSKPDFDPYQPSHAKLEQLFNMATLGALEMGSIFKNLTLAIAYDTNTITSQDMYDISYMKVGKFLIKDTHPRKGWHTVSEIFLHSSNIGVAQIILEVGQENFRKYLKTLGLLDQLNIELPERAFPYKKKMNEWNDLSLVTMSYGYALSISPLHFMQAMLPVINGGNHYPLTLIKREPENPLVATRVFSENTSKEMRKLMRLVVTSGTGKKAEIPGYFIGGKTGTAYKASKGRYDQSKRISSFFGVLPAYNPKYAVFIMLDEPKGTKETFGFATGGWNAAPTVKRVFERIIALYGLDKINADDSILQDLINVDYKVDDEV